MGTLINALKEIFSGSNQTSPTNIPTCASNGTPNGNVDMANLASVLGASYKNADFFGDLNDVKTNCTLWCGSNVVNTPTYPAQFNGIVFVLDCRSRVTQMAFASESTGQDFYIRYFQNTVWSTWHKISMDVPSFYKNYQNESALATALDEVDTFALTDSTINLNNLKTVGKYRISLTNKNVTPMPSDWGGTSNCMIRVFKQSSFSGGVYLQLLSDDARTYYRIFWDSWGNWQRISTDIPTFYKNYTNLSSLASALGGIGVFKSYGALTTDWNSESLPGGVYSTDFSGSKLDQPNLPSSVENTNSCLFIHFRASHLISNFRIMFLMYAPSGSVRELWVNMFRSTWSGWMKIQLV